MVHDSILAVLNTMADAPVPTMTREALEKLRTIPELRLAAALCLAIHYPRMARPMVREGKETDSHPTNNRAGEQSRYVAWRNFPSRAALPGHEFVSMTSDAGAAREGEAIERLENATRADRAACYRFIGHRIGWEAPARTYLSPRRKSSTFAPDEVTEAQGAQDRPILNKRYPILASVRAHGKISAHYRKRLNGEASELKLSAEICTIHDRKHRTMEKYKRELRKQFAHARRIDPATVTRKAQTAKRQLALLNRQARHDVPAERVAALSVLAEFAPAA